MTRALPTIASPAAATRWPLRRGGLAPALILAGYLLAAVAVTWRLWADPASHTVAGNPTDADLFAWFFRYDAAAVLHGRLPALVTTAMNPPRGVNLMWNTSMLLPGVLLAPVTLLFGPQVSLTVFMTAGFAGSAASLFLVLRRWAVTTGPAALAGAVYGFSPALLQSSVGHYNLQFAVLPPLIIDAGLRLCVRSRAPVRDGVLLGLLVTAQLLTAEELLLLTGITGLLLVAVTALARPRAAAARCATVAVGLGAAAGVTLLLAGYPLWVQFFGPLTQHGSSFARDFYVNDLGSFVTPSGYLLFHTAASAAFATRYQGGAPEYLGYLGWPLIAVLAAVTLAFWRQPAIKALAVTLAALELLSLGGRLLVGGTYAAGVTLPWHWLEEIPVLGTALPDRISILADGTAAALLAFGIDLALARTAAPARRARALATAAAAIACLPLIPLPLRAATAPPLPAGWPAAFAALHLPAEARVLVVPVPTGTLTDAMRWQADTGEPGSLVGGYFIGPAWNGQAYVDGDGESVTAQYLDRLWSAGQGDPAAPAAPPGPAPDRAQVRADLASWRPAAVVAVTSPGSPLARYLRLVFGPPSFEGGGVLAWRR